MVIGLLRGQFHCGAACIPESDSRSQPLSAHPHRTAIVISTRFPLERKTSVPMATQEENGNSGRGTANSLTHPTRRRILRYLHRCGEPKGGSEVAKALDQPTSQIAYHLKALESDGTTREVGPASADSLTYESAVKENDEVLELLEATEASDEDESREAA